MRVNICLEINTESATMSFHPVDPAEDPLRHHFPLLRLHPARHRLRGPQCSQYRSYSASFLEANLPRLKGQCHEMNIYF
jgi:hypothetical protein